MMSVHKRICLSIIVVLVLGLTWVTSAQQPNSATHPVWEYKCLSTAGISARALNTLRKANPQMTNPIHMHDAIAHETETDLNARGAQGWELVYYGEALAIFKRSKS